MRGVSPGRTTDQEKLEGTPALHGLPCRQPLHTAKSLISTQAGWPRLRELFLMLSVRAQGGSAVPQVAQLQLQPTTLLASEIHHLPVGVKDLADRCTPGRIVTDGRVRREYRMDEWPALGLEGGDPFPVTRLRATEQFTRQRQKRVQRDGRCGHINEWRATLSGAHGALPER